MTDAAQRVVAFAPATVANVGVGFDTLGFALADVGDRVTITRTPSARPTTITIDRIDGVATVPTDVTTNCATVALGAVIRAVDPTDRADYAVEIDKGIPLGSGMGGSAASAVAAAVAGAALFDRADDADLLLEAALAGEAAASGVAHADNVAPALRGGMTLSWRPDRASSFTVESLPLPTGLHAAVVHADVRIDTRSARAALAAAVPLALHVEQAACLAAFVHACHTRDAAGLGRAVRDLVIGPQRAAAIPQHDAMRTAALDAGALAVGIAGSGPSLFALAVGATVARTIADAMAAAAGSARVSSWVSPLPAPGAHVHPNREVSS